MALDPLLTIEDAAKACAFKNPRTVYAWMKPRPGWPTFPQPIHLGRSVRWRESKVKAFLNELEARSQKVAS